MVFIKFKKTFFLYMETYRIPCILVCASLWGIYHMTLKQFKLWEVSTLVDSIVVVGELTSCALIYCVCV